MYFGLSQYSKIEVCPRTSGSQCLFGRGPTDDGHVAGCDSVFFASARVLRNMPNVVHRIGFWTIDPAVGWGLGFLFVTNGLQKPRLHGLCGHQLQNRGVRQAICRDVSQCRDGSRPKVLQISVLRQIKNFTAPVTASIVL